MIGASLLITFRQTVRPQQTVRFYCLHTHTHATQGYSIEWHAEVHRNLHVIILVYFAKAKNVRQVIIICSFVFRWKHCTRQFDEVSQIVRFTLVLMFMRLVANICFVLYNILQMQH